MHASIVVLSALVAVAAGSYWDDPWSMPIINPMTGTPFDTPEVAALKVYHNAELARRGGAFFLNRKRREAVAPEAPETHETAAPAEGAQPQKRQALLAYTAPVPAWSTPVLRSSWNSWDPLWHSAIPYSYNPWLLRKRRDTTEAEAPKKSAAPMEEHKQDKRQVVITPYGTIAPVWNPYMSPYYSGIYSPQVRIVPSLLRKRRDTDAQSAPATEETSDDKRDKRYAFGITPYGAVYTTPLVIPTAYNSWHSGPAFRSSWAQYW